MKEESSGVEDKSVLLCALSSVVFVMHVELGLREEPQPYLYTGYTPSKIGGVVTFQLLLTVCGHSISTIPIGRGNQ